MVCNVGTVGFSFKTWLRAHKLNRHNSKTTDFSTIGSIMVRAWEFGTAHINRSSVQQDGQKCRKHKETR